MSEHGDDTTERDAPSRSERQPGSYYYDDATGYEIYDPSNDEEEREDTNGSGTGAGSKDGEHSN